LEEKAVHLSWWGKYDDNDANNHNHPDSHLEAVKDGSFVPAGEIGMYCANWQ